MWYVTLALAADPDPTAPPGPAPESAPVPAPAPAPGPEPEPSEPGPTESAEPPAPAGVVGSPAPGPDPLDEARRRAARGAWVTGVGLGAVVGGVFVLSYGRGDSGEISQEEPWVMDLRSVGGALLTMGGLVTLVAGGQDLSAAHRLRSRSVAVAPVWMEGGAGARVEARF